MSSLLSGVAFLVMGTGLMFAAISTQAAAADFPVVVTGLIMSAYFGGFIFGTYACPVIINRVGHIRTFAAMASIASTAPILHALWLNPWFWGLLRFVTGVCLVGLFIAVESWLNVIARSEQRGKVFAAYMAVSGVAMAISQWMILVGDKLGFVPFAMVSIMFSLALLPITMTPVREPTPVDAPKLGLAELFAVSPIGVIGAVCSGLLSGAFYSLGQVFGQRAGISDAGIATFMAATILGGAAFQWPVGQLSDRHDRRQVLAAVSAAAALVAIAGFYLAQTSEAALIAIGIVYGGLTFTIYGLSVAHVNDLIDRSRVLQATGGLLLLYGIGATVGPTLAGALMDLTTPGSLLLYFAVVLISLALCIRHYTRGRPQNRGEPGQKDGYVMMGGGSQAVLQLDPRAEETNTAPTRQRSDALPSALTALGEFQARMQGKHLAIFLDYDGTLTPIVQRPELALLSAEMRAAVQALAQRCTVVVMSGRDLPDVQARVGLEDIVYGGSHGFEICGPQGMKIDQQHGSEFLPQLDQAELALRERLGNIAGILVERKKYSIAVHFRQVGEADLQAVGSAVDTVLAVQPKLRKTDGKKIFELQPNIEWDKGRAMVWLLDKLGLERFNTFLLYLGDDITDEDAFRSLNERGNGMGILVRDEARDTAAQYALENPEEVRSFLLALTALAQNTTLSGQNP